MKCIDRLRFVAIVEMLQLDLERVQRVGIEQLAKLRLTEQLAKLGLIDGQRLGAAFGERGIAVVDEIRHVSEEQRPRERRRLLGVGNYDAGKILPAWGQPFDIARPGIAVKQYPCCGSTGTA